MARTRLDRVVGLYFDLERFYFADQWRQELLEGELLGIFGVVTGRKTQIIAQTTWGREAAITDQYHIQRVKSWVTRWLSGYIMILMLTMNHPFVNITSIFFDKAHTLSIISYSGDCMSDCRRLKLLYYGSVNNLCTSTNPMRSLAAKVFFAAVNSVN